MIARCPQCQTRYRIAREKIGPSGARIRCSSCTTVFRVQAPPEPAIPAPEAPVEMPAPAPAPPPPPLGRVLLAEPDAVAAKAVADLLEGRRLSVDLAIIRNCNVVYPLL